jgi:DNA-binding transcriptional MerR regulator
MLRVGEIEAKYGLTRKTLRYWEDIGIVQPRYVGTHRAYGPLEIERLLTVRALIKAGYTPKQLQGIFRASDALPPRVMNEDQVFRGLLEQTSRGRKVELDVGSDFTRYNSAYKRLHRLARRMGIQVETQKTGPTLTVRGKASRARTNPAKARRPHRRANG